MKVLFLSLALLTVLGAAAALGAGDDSVAWESAGGTAIAVLEDGPSGGGAPAADGAGVTAQAVTAARPYQVFALQVAGDAPRPPATPHVALFDKPFTGEYGAANFFDHDVPREFVDTNGRFITYWGESIVVGIDGHSGYDWGLPEGTPVLAAAAGRVTFAGTETPFACPILDGKIVAANYVNIDHVIQLNGAPLTIQSAYLHLSRIDVTAGQEVSQGEQIGLSGNTGCSTGPHLHFGTRRQVAPNRFVQIDPYGWEGAGPDPWANTPGGAPSIYLWDQAPPLYKESRLGAPPAGKDPVEVAAVRWLGYRDDLNPNNEFVEVALDPRFATSAVDMTGWTIRNNRNDTYTFPSGYHVRPDQPVPIYSGTGTNSATTLYWGRAAGVWDDLGDCAHLIDAKGNTFELKFAAACK